MTFTIRGGRKMIISEVLQIPDEVLQPSHEVSHAPHKSLPRAPRQRTDNALLKAIAWAHRWRSMIETGEYASITELAKAEDVNQSYACRILRLTLLAPAIISEILDRRYASDLMLKRLMKSVPIQWNEQMLALHMTQRDVPEQSLT
jgi:hypothetical protein